MSSTTTETALDHHYIGHTFMDSVPHLTIASFYAALRHELFRTLDDYLVDHREWKMCSCLHIIVSKSSEERSAHFHLPSIALQSYELDEEKNEMERRLEEFNQKGSGWRMVRIDNLEWRFTQFTSIPFHVGHARNFKLPMKLAAKQSVINITNAPDGECFKYALLSVLHYSEISRNRQRAAKYHPWLNELDFTGIDFPFQARDLPVFERRNPTLAINLLKWKKTGSAGLVRGSPVIDGRRVINIRIVDTHYVGVVDINSLLNDRTGHNRHVCKYCNRCLRPFFSQCKLNEHLPACMRNQQRQYNMPLFGKNNLSFSNFAKTISPTHVIYGDIECMLLPGGEHCPIMCGYVTVPNSSLTALQNTFPSYHSFVGRDCIRQLLSHLCNQVETLCEFNEKYGRENMKPLSPSQQRDLNDSQNCYLCRQPFAMKRQSQEKVRDHDHFSGEYIGPACSKCNLSRRNRRSSFPIVFHNLKGYDAHHLIKEGVGHFPSWNLSVVPTTKEGYLSLRCSFGNGKGSLQFIDSLRFLSASLATLVSNCPLLPLTSTLPGSDIVKLSSMS